MTDGAWDTIYTTAAFHLETIASTATISIVLFVGMKLYCGFMREV